MSDIHSFTDMMEEAWMRDSRLPGAPISKSHVTGFPQVRAEFSPQKILLIQTVSCNFFPGPLFYL